MGLQQNRKRYCIILPTIYNTNYTTATMMLELFELRICAQTLIIMNVKIVTSLIPQFEYFSYENITEKRDEIAFTNIFFAIFVLYSKAINIRNTYLQMIKHPSVV